MPRMMTGLPSRFVQIKHGSAGIMDGELATFFETDTGLELFSQEMEFYDEKTKKKFKESGQSSRNNNLYTSVNSEQGIENHVFEDLISIVEDSSNRMSGGHTDSAGPLPGHLPSPDLISRSAVVRLPGEVAGGQIKLVPGSGQVKLSHHLVSGSPEEEGGFIAPPPASFLEGDTSPSSATRFGGASPPSRNTSFLAETQVESSSSSQKKIFYSSLGYPSVPGLRAPSVSPSGGGRTSKSPVSGRLSCSPPIRSSQTGLSTSSPPIRSSQTGLSTSSPPIRSSQTRLSVSDLVTGCSPPGTSSLQTRRLSNQEQLNSCSPPTRSTQTRRLSSGEQLGSSSSPPIRSWQTRRLSNSERHQGGGSPTRPLSGGRTRRNSCEHKMSCSPPGSGWSAATWTQLPLPTATQVLTTAPFGGDQQQQLPSLRTSFPGGSSSNAGCGYLGAAVNSGSGGFTGGAVNNTSEKRCSSAPAPDNVSPLRDQEEQIQYPASLTGVGTSPTCHNPTNLTSPTSNNFTSLTSNTTTLTSSTTSPTSLASPRWSSSPGSAATTSPQSSLTTTSDLSSPLSSRPAAPADTKPVPECLPPIRPENSILRQQLQGKLSNRYNNETVTCRECGKMLTVKCIMGTCLKSDEVLCQSCNMELTVKCILGSCRTTNT